MFSSCCNWSTVKSYKVKALLFISSSSSFKLQVCTLSPGLIFLMKDIVFTYLISNFQLLSELNVAVAENLRTLQSR